MKDILTGNKKSKKFFKTLSTIEQQELELINAEIEEADKRLDTLDELFFKRADA